MTELSPYTRNPSGTPIWFLGLETQLLRRIVSLGWPVIIGMLSQTAINTVDLLLVGRLPESVAVPGTAAMFSSIILLWAFGGFLSAISVGTQAITARRFSEGNLDKTGQVLTNAIAVAIVASLLMMLLAEQIVEPIMALLSPSHSVQQIGASYSRIRFIGLISMALMAGYKSFYDGMGRVRIHMTVAICMNIANAILCYLLVFGFSIGSYTFEPLYVDGAAFAAVITSYMGLFVMIAWSLRKGDRQRFKIYRWSNFDWGIAKSVSKLSLWSGLATVVLMAGVGLFSHIVGMIDEQQGLDAVNSSAASIIIHVMMLVFMTCLAFGTSTATLVSQSIGAKNPDLAERYGWQSVLLAVYIMTIFGMIAYLFPEPILRIFMPAELNTAGSLKDEVVRVALPALKIAVSLLSPVAAAAMVLTQALYGAGKTRYVLVVEFVLHFGCLVPVSWLLGVVFKMGLLGCWLAAVAYATLLLVAMSVQFAKGNWKDTIL